MKIFGIGFHKTGTKSLARALRLLGFTVTGPNGVEDPDIAVTAWPMVRSLVPQFDAFQDNPWPLFYRELDREFPGSRFILTVRETESWLRSVVGYFGTKETPMRRWIYGHGSPVGQEAVYRERYERHQREVTEYFRARAGDLLVMDFERGDGWAELCPFVGRAPPGQPFPHVNARA